MAQIALTVAGYAIGGPAGGFIGGMIGGVIDRELLFKQDAIEGPRLEELKVQISSYGVAIPELWGTMRVGGNVIWADEIHEVSSTDGGKSSPDQTSYKYDATFAVALCRGPISGLIRIWADSTLIYDARPSPLTSLPVNSGGVVVSYAAGAVVVFPVTLVEEAFTPGRFEITFDTGVLAGVSIPIQSWDQDTYTFSLSELPFASPGAGDEWHIEGIENVSGTKARRRGSSNPYDPNAVSFDLYLGDETQTADPTIEAVEGAGLVPAFRGLAYIVIKNFRLEQYGNRIPNFTFEISKDTTVVNQVVAYPDSVGNDENGYDRPDMFDRTMLLHPDGHTIVTEGFAFDVLTGEFKAAGDPDDMDWDYDLMQYEFDFDEEGFVYAWRLTGGGNGQFVKYDLDIGFMAEVASGPIVSVGLLPNGGSVLRVSRNASAPYMWWINATNGALRAGPRDQLGGSGSTLAFPESDSSIFARYIDIDHATGDAWIVFAKVASAPRRLFVRRVKVGQFGLQYLDWEITSDVPALNSGTYPYIKYDATTSQIVIGLNSAYYGESPDEAHLYFFDVSQSTGDNWDAPTYLGVLPDVDGLFLGGTNGVSHAFNGPTPNGKMYFAAGVGGDVATYRYIKVDLATRAVEAEYIPEEVGGYTFSTFVFIPSLNAIFADWWDVQVGGGNATVNDGPHRYYVLVLLDRISDAGAPLSLIVSDISELVGLEAADITVTALTDTVDGYVLNSRMSARSAIEPLMQAFFFDAVEVDGKVKFVKRGGSSIVSIPESDLAAHFSGSQRPQELITTRQQELELPQTVEVSYVNRAFDYQVGTQRERRLVTRSQEKMQIRLPISMTDDDAKQIAVKMLGIAWLQRTRHEINVSRKYMWLTPTDVITVNEGGVAQIVRIEDGSYEGGVIRFPLAQEDSETYESDAPGVGGGAAGGGGGDVVVPIQGVTRFVVGDIPTIPSIAGAFSVEAQNPGVYVVATGQDDSWTGANVLRSRDGSTFTHLVRIETGGVVGKAVTALGDVADPFIWDLGNAVQVQLLDPNDSLASAFEDSVLNGANLAILGSEVISFRTVVDNGNGLYTLSRLIRGRYGSDDRTGSHVVGEDFALLYPPGHVKFFQLPIEDLNTLTRFRGQTLGTDIAEGTNQSKTITFRNLKPLSPQHVSCQRATDGVTVVVSWMRRTRFGGEWNDGAEVPIGEASEEYEIDLYDGATFLRTLTAVIKTTSYRYAYYFEADQDTDGIGPSDAITAIVYQISNTVGRGIASASATSNQ